MFVCMTLAWLGTGYLGVCTGEQNIGDFLGVRHSSILWPVVLGITFSAPFRDCWSFEFGMLGKMSLP